MLTPFNPNATCPKCGGGEIGARHVQAINDRAYGSRGCVKIGCSHEEHLKRTCTTCGYSWPEAPRDREEG